MGDTMNGTGAASAIRDEIRSTLMARPDAILEDHDLMRALVAANDRAMGANVVDLRSIAMTRLEARLDRLEDTHRNVIAAAYDNLAGTATIQRAVLRLIEPETFTAFVDALDDVAAILNVDALHLVFEAGPDDADGPVQHAPGARLVRAAPGLIESHAAGGRAGAARRVTLRRCPVGPPAIYGDDGGAIRSEAVLCLDLGPGHRPAMLVLGARDADQFAPAQGGDLLAFLAATVERVMRRWVA
jgi:hypothetical protein